MNVSVVSDVVPKDNVSDHGGGLTNIMLKSEYGAVPPVTVTLTIAPVLGATVIVDGEITTVKPGRGRLTIRYANTRTATAQKA